MKNRWILLGSILGVLILALAAGLSRAQGPEPPGEGVQPQDVSIEAAVANRIPIQGRLTDASGNPLNGNYSVTASIYNVSSGGTALCSKTQSVNLSNGLFNMTIDNCTSAILNGQQLYLGIKVGTDAEMTPRQPIYPVPYAWSLRPGALISDTQDFPNYILRVRNEGSGWAIQASTNGHIAIEGWNANTAPGKPGIWGGSQYGIGVVGETRVITGYGVAGFQPGYSTSDTGQYWESGGLFGGHNGVIGISKVGWGYGVFGWNKATSGSSIGVCGRTDSSNGWAGLFLTDAGNGVYISVPSGKTGLNVASGTKSAVVRAEGGSRLLYTEESTEVWFTDYGFGKLQNGVAVISIDPLFAQTVNLNEPYHVFVQPYGNASLYVTNRTPTSFEVRLHDGDPNVEFSYRIVAKRLGYEDTRLERAPWADNDPNLYPEKRADWEAQQGGAP